MSELSPSLEAVVDMADNPQSVPVNMYETTESLVVIAPMAGVMQDDIEIEIDGRELKLSARMRTPGIKDFLLHEWHYGPYERTVEIPDGFGPTWETSFGNGQLVVRVKRTA